MAPGGVVPDGYAVGGVPYAPAPAGPVMVPVPPRRPGAAAVIPNILGRFRRPR